MILAIDTATAVCSVALSENGSLLSFRETSLNNAHSAMLTLLIQEVMHSCSLSFPGLDAIAVSSGPGSYTGLRIGVAGKRTLLCAQQAAHRHSDPSVHGGGYVSEHPTPCPLPFRGGGRQPGLLSDDRRQENGGFLCHLR